MMRSINLKEIGFRLRELFESPGILALIIVMIPVFMFIVIRNKLYSDEGVNEASKYVLEKLRENNMKLFEILYLTIVVPVTSVFWVYLIILLI